MSEASGSSEQSRSQKRAQKRKYVSSSSSMGDKRRKTRPAWDINLAGGKKLMVVSCINGKEGVCQVAMQSLMQQIALTWLEEKGMPRVPEKPEDASADSAEQKKNTEDTQSTSDETSGMEEGKGAAKGDSSEDTQNNNNTFVDITAELRKEKSLYQYKNVEWIRSPKGTIVLYCQDTRLDPVYLVCQASSVPSLLRDVSPYALKMIPIQRTCALKKEAVLQCAKRVIRDHWVYGDGPNQVKPTDTFSVVFIKTGSGKHFHRDDMVAAIADLVPVPPLPDGSDSSAAASAANSSSDSASNTGAESATVDESAPLRKHKVCLSKPDVVIYFKSFVKYAGLSVITGGRFHRFQEFSVTKLKDHTY